MCQLGLHMNGGKINGEENQCINILGDIQLHTLPEMGDVMSVVVSESSTQMLP